jgi:hypothetical protein
MGPLHAGRDGLSVASTSRRCTGDLSARPTGRWDQIDFRTGTLHVRGVKKGTPSTHPNRGRRNARACGGSNAIRSRNRRSFSPRTGAHRSPPLAERARTAAKLPFKAHPHMLRHACGFALASNGHDTHTLQDPSPPSQHPAHGGYTRLSPMPLKWTSGGNKRVTRGRRACAPEVSRGPPALRWGW